MPRKIEWRMISSQSFRRGSLSRVRFGIALYANPVRRQRAAVMAIQRLRGSVSYDYEFVEGRHQHDAAERARSPAWLRKLWSDDPLGTVTTVNVDRLTDAELAQLVPHLRNLRTLRGLSVTGDGLTDEALGEISTLTHIGGLTLTTDGAGNALPGPNKDNRCRTR